jgi:hypothetical protein
LLPLDIGSGWKEMSGGVMTPNKILKSYIYCLILFCLMCQSACSNLSIWNACGDTYPVSSSEIPEYLEIIWPSPGSILYLSCYEEYLRDNAYWYRGVGAEVRVFRVDDPTKYPPTELLPERTELFIDNQLVSRECLEIGNDLLDIIDLNEPGHKTSYGPGAYQMTWLTELGQGKHEVKIVITQNTGGVLEYSWHFYIVSEDTINIAIIGLCLLLLAAIVAFYFH